MSTCSALETSETAIEFVCDTVAHSVELKLVARLPEDKLDALWIEWKTSVRIYPPVDTQRQTHVQYAGPTNPPGSSSFF